MRWEFGRRSRNVEDRRGMGGSAPVVGGGIGLVIMAVIVTLLGGDPSAILNQAAPGDQYSRPGQVSQVQADDQMSQFVSVVLADTEDTWNGIFQQMGERYVEPKLVLFSGSVQSACGNAGASTGPFYCPRDQKVYIDLSFYEQMKYELNAPGDFAQAYVIAHEIGHHVQNLLGISGQVQSLQQRVSKAQANQLSVRLELQADCFAGIWGNDAQRSRQVLQEGDVEEALNAATAIGDDRLQSQSRGYVVPESFTHGSSAQRVRWFKKGIQTGDINQCNTFDTKSL
ncbi:MAG: zinc metallopeptidase [Drouetiella hepatica Uher 2000/2452]|uniref:Zinc metallopeptidase n=1 Tax=Drouetiella hepatica Uher 2000/2452 TaxID=904376 RepID=A0A951UQY4_9CYAN|nr:zinc metallopeptidase [Drouetiella hepatica Uher 2000/2452]